MSSAEREAIRVFARNLRDLLLAAPAGRARDDGARPGPSHRRQGRGRRRQRAAAGDRRPSFRTSRGTSGTRRSTRWRTSPGGTSVELVSIGNGTGSRETDRLVSDLLKRHAGPAVSQGHRLGGRRLGVLGLEAGGRASWPTLDVSLRGAVSIARRLQDPLAELVKIEPRSIGVGQYQHDVNQAHLARALGGVVEDCVNAVGVDSTRRRRRCSRACPALNRRLADNVVAFRQHGGPVPRPRASSCNVPGLGEKAFEQAAGFLRIVGGDNPLDASAVHPEAYPVVERICEMTGHGRSAS